MSAQHTVLRKYTSAQILNSSPEYLHLCWNPLWRRIFFSFFSIQTQKCTVLLLCIFLPNTSDFDSVHFLEDGSSFHCNPHLLCQTTACFQASRSAVTHHLWSKRSATDTWPLSHSTGVLYFHLPIKKTQERDRNTYGLVQGIKMTLKLPTGITFLRTWYTWYIFQMSAKTMDISSIKHLTWGIFLADIFAWL